MSVPHFDDVDAAADAILARLGRRIVLGTPLGIGKPNALLDALYARAQKDAALSLDIITALSLNPPRGSSALESRFLAPVIDRVWGDYPAMRWLSDFEAGQLPDNVRVIEFYVPSGARLKHPRAQQDYISSNYTHVARDMVSRGVNLLVQAVAVREDDGTPCYSLAGNPDVSLQLLPMLQSVDWPWMAVGMVNRGLPWMGNDAQVDDSLFDVLIDDGGPGHRPLCGAARAGGRQRLGRGPARRQPGARRRHPASGHRQSRRCLLPCPASARPAACGLCPRPSQT